MNKNRIRYKTFDQVSFADMMVYSKLPAHPFWSHIESQLDFSFADKLCSVLYTGRGQRPYAPSLKLKIHLIQIYYHLSDRQTEEKIMGDLFIKRFLGLPVDFFGFDHSTIGLDRDRLGVTMFHACHLQILSQLYNLGLWGDKDEQWIIDSFPSNAGVVIVGAYRLIQQGMLRIMQQLKRSNHALYKRVGESVSLEVITHRLSPNCSKGDMMVAFSKLVVQAYGLLYVFENDRVSSLFWQWDNKNAQLKSLELQALLCKILIENSKPYEAGDQKDLTSEEKSDCTPGANDSATPVDEEPISNSDALVPHEPDSQEDSLPKGSNVCPSVADNSTFPVDRELLSNPDPLAETKDEVPDQSQEESPTIEYSKIPRNERRSHRIINAYDPDARVGAKNRFTMIKGYKTQNLCTTSGVILNVKAIPASEHDREAMVGMAKEIQQYFGITPSAILGDTAYGHGQQRAALDLLGVNVIAPVPITTAKNPNGLFDISRFTYDKEKDCFTCPNGKKTVRKQTIPKLEGTQYFFGKANCSTCPFNQECTTNKNGRSVFLSDYHKYYDKAKAFNESEEGKAAYQKRNIVERKNNELKNDCGLGEPRTRSLKPLDIKANLAAMAVNIKYTVRRLIAPNPGFLRREPKFQ